MSFDAYGERDGMINAREIPAVIGKVATKAAQVRRLIGSENGSAKQIARLIEGLDGVSITALFEHLDMLRPVDRIGSGQALDSVAIGRMLAAQLGGSSRVKQVWVQWVKQAQQAMKTGGAEMEKWLREILATKTLELLNRSNAGIKII